MSRAFMCPLGHCWESADPGSTTAALACPVCGAAPLPPHHSSDAETLFPSAPGFQSANTLMPRDGERPFVTGRDVHVPGYEILGELGRGGMGVVYKARQVRVNRIVALKMILSGAHAAQNLLDRFRTEAEAVARLQHPNIVQIYEVGEHDHLPYFSLEYCPGGLDRKLDGKPLKPQEAAGLVEQLARAMHAAHRKGIIHRDLKPANVLLTEDNSPKITDFGLAKKLEEAGQTQSGSVLGTPSYMAPEQAAGRSKDIGPAVDTYALGAILYECLTGRPPFVAATSLDTIMQVVGDDPVPPTQLQSRTPRDLETICLKCLQKEPAKRYASAADLAEDLRRFLAGRPIKARPIGRAELAWRWCRRNSVVAALTAAAVALLVLVAVVAAAGYWQTSKALIRADREKQRAKAAQASEAEERAVAIGQRDAAQRNLYLAQMHLAQQAWEIGNTGRLQELLDRQILKPDEADFRGWEWHYLHNQTRGLVRLRGRTAAISMLQWSPDSTRLASAGGQGDFSSGELKIWDTSTGHLLFTLGDPLPNFVNAISWSPDGKRLASSGGVHSGAGNAEPGTIQLWDATTGKELAVLRGLTGKVNSIAWSPDGRRLASSSGEQPGHVKLWDASSGTQVSDMATHGDALNSVSWRPDGSQLAAASSEGTILIWDATNGKEIRQIRGTAKSVFCALWSPNGSQIASVTAEPAVHIWDAATGRELLTIPAAPEIFLAWQTESRVALTYADGVTRIWDLATKKTVETFTSHVPMVSSAAWSPDSRRLALASADQTIQIRDIAPIAEALVLHGGSGPAGMVAWSPDGKRLATTGAGIRIWEMPSGRKRLDLQVTQGSSVFSLSWGPDSRRLVSANSGKLDANLRIWDTTLGQCLYTWNEHQPPAHVAAWSLDGHRLASGHADGTIRLWDAESRREIRTLKGHNGFVNALSWRPDSQWLASAGVDGTVRLWPATVAPETLVIRSRAGPVRSVAWSPNGQSIATGGGDLKIWDASTGKMISSLRGHNAPVVSVAWSRHPEPDRQRLASVSLDGTLKIWDLITGQEVLTLHAQQETPAQPADRIPVFNSIAWSPDGQRLVAGCEDGAIKVWDATEVRKLAK